MPVFQTIIHPTDFDETSREAFRVARSLAQVLGAQVVVFHVVPPPTIITQDGKVILDPKHPKPIDLWVEYRKQAASTPGVTVEYAVVVGQQAEAKQLLEAEALSFGQDVLVVMGTHGRTGITRLFWGSKAEDFVREFPCPVLVVKAPGAAVPGKSPVPEVKVPAGAPA